MSTISLFVRAKTNEKIAINLMENYMDNKNDIYKTKNYLYDKIFK